MRQLLFSLRFRLMLLVFLAIIPATGLIVYTSAHERQSLAEATRREMLNLALLASARQDWLTESTRQLLAGLARLPEVKQGEAEACSTLFAGLLAEYPLYANLIVTLPNGDRWCSALPADEPVNYADRAWFQEAVRARGFVAGGYVMGRVTRRPLATFAYPLLAEAGQVQAVVAAGMDLAWLNASFAQLPLPEGAVLSVLDSHGVLLARTLEAERWVGQTVPEPEIVQVVLEGRGGGTLEPAGVDEVRRLYAYAPLQGSAGETGYVAVGIPTALVYAGADRVLRGNLAALGGVTLLALAAAFVVGEAFVVRRVNALMTATRRMAQGDLRARTGMPYGVSELSQLARAFDEMADALESQEREHKRAAETIHLQVTALEAAANAIVITDREGTIQWVNPAWVALTGYTPEEAIGQNPRILKSGRQDETFYRELWETILAGKVWRSELVNRRKDGSLYTEEETITPLVDSSGRVTHFIAIKQDITERKEAEQAQQRLISILEATPDFVGTATPDGQVLYYNRAAHPQWAARIVLEEAIPTVMREGVWSGETALLSRDGREIPVLQVALAHGGPDGSVEFLSTIARDITERKQREQELEALAEVSSTLRQAQNLEAMRLIVLEATLRVMGAQAGTFFLLDGKRQELYVAAALGYPIDVSRLRLKLGQGLAGECARSGKPILTDDIAADARVVTPQAFVGLHKALCVPLKSAEGLVGVLLICFAAAGQPSPAEVNLLTSITDMAGNALQRAHLHEETLRRVAQLQALQTIDAAIAASLDVRLSLNILLEQTVKQLDVDAVAALLLNPHLNLLEYAAGRGFRARLIESSRVGLGSGFAGRAALERQLVHMPDLNAASDDFISSLLLAGEGFVSYVGAPLIAKGQVKGVLEVFHRS
ncbi:MAG: PAS domain S-box protein, partial [Chloroflexi bacterium]|nr:PAS domain S-box protein [Chloroflexota bacterium]